jgi:hypothetical protein
MRAAFSKAGATNFPRAANDTFAAKYKSPARAAAVRNRSAKIRAEKIAGPWAA